MNKEVIIDIDNPQNDLVRREAVCNIINDIRDCISVEGYCAIIERLKKLQPVTPQPKAGEWIGDAKTYYEELNKRGLGVDEYTPYFTDDIACSECLAKYSMLDNETQFFKYCPNCGAKMENVQNL